MRFSLECSSWRCQKTSLLWASASLTAPETKRTGFGGFSNWGYPQIIKTNWIFQKNHPFWGTPIFGKPPCKTSQDLSFFLRQLSRNGFFGVSVANLAIWLISALGIVTIWLHRFVALSKTNRNEELPSISPKRTIAWWRSKTTALA